MITMMMELVVLNDDDDVNDDGGNDDGVVGSDVDGGGWCRCWRNRMVVVEQ
jgi:hypothetical protein